MALYESIPIVKNVFEIFYIRNPGTAWGLLANKQFLFAISTVIIFIVCIIVYIRCVRLSKYKDIRILLIFILAGGMGNFIDRIRYKYVIDFLYFKLIDFPVFNVADCYITVAVIVFLIICFFVLKENELDYLMSSKKKWQVENEAE